MIMRRIHLWILETNETLLDLLIGCLIYSFLLEVIGLVAVSNKLSYSLGLLLGTAVAMSSAISMAVGIRRVLEMDQKSASRNGAFYSILRMIVMLVAAWIGMKVSIISFYSVIIGMLGLKISAYMHVYTNVYITKKIRRKGR